MKKKVISRGDLLCDNTILAPDCVITYSHGFKDSLVFPNFDRKSDPIGIVKSVEEILDKNGKIEGLTVDISLFKKGEDIFKCGVGGTVIDERVNGDGYREIIGFDLKEVSIISNK